jgi:hypothetical protein
MSVDVGNPSISDEIAAINWSPLDTGSLSGRLLGCELSLESEGDGDVFLGLDGEGNRGIEGGGGGSRGVDKTRGGRSGKEGNVNAGSCGDGCAGSGFV